MNPFFKFIIIFFLIITTAKYSEASPKMAFGYLANTSLELNFDYLETIFPNSFANSIKNIFDVEVIKPLSVNKKLKEYNIKLKKHYKYHEIPEIVEKIDVDFFIFGKFTPLADDKIKIVLNLYQQGSDRIFTFTNIGRMETEIFRLVDRITRIFINYVDAQMYQNGIIRRGSRLGIITNLNPPEQNILYAEFMKKGYMISSLQGNTLYNIVNNKSIKKFDPIYTAGNSYDIITDIRKIKFLSKPWEGKKQIEQLSYLKKIYRIYDRNYPETKNRMLDSLANVYTNIDYLLIIGFNNGRSDAWIRAIHLKRKDLIWMHSNIEGDDIREVTQKIIKRMKSPVTVPFQKKETK